MRDQCRRRAWQSARATSVRSSSVTKGAALPARHCRNGRRSWREWYNDAHATSPIGRQMKTSPFAAILEAARTRYGAAALDARLLAPRTPAELAATPDDRFLSQM